MKITSLAFLGLALVAIPARSQTAPATPSATPPSPAQMAARDPVLKNAAALGLTPQQISAIDAILLDAWNTEQTIKANTAITPAQQEEQTHANRKAAHREVHDLLTKPQRRQLHALLSGAPAAGPTPTP